MRPPALRMLICHHTALSAAWSCWRAPVKVPLLASLSASGCLLCPGACVASSSSRVSAHCRAMSAARAGIAAVLLLSSPCWFQPVPNGSVFVQAGAGCWGVEEMPWAVMAYLSRLPSYPPPFSFPTEKHCSSGFDSKAHCFGLGPLKLSVLV